MNALVTGGAGFIGSNIVKLLLENKYRVKVIDNLSTGNMRNLQGLDVEFVRGDICTPQLLSNNSKDIDVIFHLAASVGRQKSIDNPQEDSLVNVIGTLNVIEAAKINSIPRIVYSSSAAIYGELMTPVINEDHPQNPDSPYGVSKLAAEKHLLAGSAIYGFKAIGLRYFNVYGINQRYDAYGNVIPIFAKNIFSRKYITIYGDGEQTRDFVNVKDVAMANYLAATSEIETDVFNVGSGISITINFLADCMRKISQLDTDIRYAPKRVGDVIHCKADIAKINKCLGFSPAVNIESELVNYLNWFKADLDNHDK
jgi:nucleoside-diphosphate-sugar epimerase